MELSRQLGSGLVVKGSTLAKGVEKIGEAPGQRWIATLLLIFVILILVGLIAHACLSALRPSTQEVVHAADLDSSAGTSKASGQWPFKAKRGARRARGSAYAALEPQESQEDDETEGDSTVVCGDEEDATQPTRGSKDSKRGKYKSKRASAR